MLQKVAQPFWPGLVSGPLIPPMNCPSHPRHPPAPRAPDPTVLRPGLPSLVTGVLQGIVAGACPEGRDGVVAVLLVATRGVRALPDTMGDVGAQHGTAGGVGARPATARGVGARHTTTRGVGVRHATARGVGVAWITARTAEALRPLPRGGTGATLQLDPPAMLFEILHGLPLFAIDVDVRDTRPMHVHEPPAQW